jgi:hypothetical protein
LRAFDMLADEAMPQELVDAAEQLFLLQAGHALQ